MDSMQGSSGAQERAAYDGAQQVLGAVIQVLEQGLAYRDHVMALLLGLLLAYFFMKFVQAIISRVARKPAVLASARDRDMGTAGDPTMATKIDVQVMLENMFQHLESRLQQLATGSADGGVSTVTLSVDTVVDAVGQAINSKMLELRPFEKVTSACAEALNSLLGRSTSNSKPRWRGTRRSYWAN